MSSDTQYTALGPTQIGFQTHGARIKIGADIEGTEAGVIGRCKDRTGVSGDGKIGVHGKGSGAGVLGTGVAESVEDGTRFPGKTGMGVLGQSQDNEGVRGESDLSDGVVGTAKFHQTAGVFGVNTGIDEMQNGSVEFPERHAAGFGVYGLCHLSQGAGVGGTNDGADPRTGIGGPGVQGISLSGYGGIFRGGRAPIMLQPSVTKGPPTEGSHQMGELYPDHSGALYYCTKSGEPGQWMRVRLEPE